MPSPMPEHDPTRTDRLALYMRARAAKRAAQDEAVRVVERWNTALATGRGALWSPTIRAALLAGTPWLDVYCSGCRTSRAIDIRTIDRHALASVGSLVLGLRCSWCHGSAPMPVLAGLHALPPAVQRSPDGETPHPGISALTNVSGVLFWTSLAAFFS